MPQTDTYFAFLALVSVLGFILITLLIRARQAAQFSNERLQMTQAELNTTLSHQKQLTADQQTLETTLNQGQKLLAMGTLAGGIAHDFNNLLYAIQGYIEMCRQDAKDNSPLQHNLGKVLEATERGQALVARILTFSRRQQHLTSPLSLKATFDAALSLLQPTIPSSVHIQVDLPKDITVLGNQTELHQVIVNLVTNAVDAMDGEGSIHIAASLAEANDPRLQHFTNLVHTRYAVITVTDTGQGMDKSMLNRIFEPFFTTKEVGKGTGLGLSIVHSILMEHQGGIHVESELGHGTTFTLLLPEYPKSVKEQP